MNEKSELDYMRGARAAWLFMFAECLRQLGYDDVEAGKALWISEREEAIGALRMVCEDHGDNDWHEELHLADIISKHLHGHLAAP